MVANYREMKKARMHSSRMRTVRGSGRLGEGPYPGVSAWGSALEGGRLPWGCLPGGVSALGDVRVEGGVHIPLWTERHL